MTSAVSGGRSHRAAILALALVPAVLFAPALAGGVFFQRDLHAYWQPQVETLVRVVAEGALPLWDPYEGFGLPAAESLACGVPTLVSTDRALLEVTGDAALAVDDHSVESIAAGLERLLLDEDLRAKLAEAGPRHVARFTWEAAARTVLDVYKTVVGSR